MIHHYINLVCWRSMLEMYQPRRDIVWMDSVSITKLVGRYRSGAVYQPGTSVLSKIGPGTHYGGTWFFLTPGPMPALSANAYYALPSFKVPFVPEELLPRLMTLAPGTRVGLGISAPKQNQLAALLHEQRPDLEYHCLGAAIVDLICLDATRDANGAHVRAARLSGSGMEWVRFLHVSPLRTWRKIIVTLKEMLLIGFHPPSRSAFKRFAEICASAQSNCT